MTTNAADIAASMCATLAFTEPNLDTSIGSVVRRIIDAVAASTAEAYFDQHLTRYQYDIDSMTAGTLEGFVRLFGMDRQQASYATGVVTFTRSTALADDTSASIPIFTQVQSRTDPIQLVQTLVSATMAVEQTTVDVPVQALVAGSRGNVAAGLLTTLAADLVNVSTTTVNVQALTGGRDAETDDELRLRWKQTVFKNIAGTEQMYRAMALETDPAVTAVNILGARKTWLDRVTITNGTSGPLSFGNPAYIYESDVYLGNNISALDFVARGAQYTVTVNNTASPATITINAVNGLPDGAYDIQYDYVPSYSRNDPFGVRFGSGSQYVNNRIDIWLNGEVPDLVTQSCRFTTSGTLRFSATATSRLYTGKFSKLNGARPSANDYFVPLSYGPVLSVPSTLVIAGTTYTLGTHYDVVQQSDAFGFSPTSLGGLVWYAAGAAPADGTAFTISYAYNTVPAKAQRLIQSQWRLMGTDLQVHAAIAVRYRFHLAVVYSRNFDSAPVNTQIDTVLASLVANLGFDSALQISDVLQAVHNVPGVDNVRFLSSVDDGTHYGMEPILPNGNPTTPIANVGGRASDVYFDDAHYPRFHSTRIVAKTRTNFGTS